MELESHRKGVLGIFHPFDDGYTIVGGFCGLDQIRTGDAADGLMVPGRNVLQLISSHDFPEMGVGRQDMHIVTGVIPVGSSRRHPMEIIMVGLSLFFVIIRQVLDHFGSGHHPQHLFTPAYIQGGDVVGQAVGLEGIVGNIPGGIDSFPVVLFLFCIFIQGRADVFPSGAEDPIHTLHHRGDVGFGKVFGFDLVGIFLLQHAGFFQSGFVHGSVTVIFHIGAFDLAQFHRDTAGQLNDFFEGRIILFVALPGNSDDRLASHHGMDIIGHPQGETQRQGSYSEDFFQFLQLHGHALPSHRMVPDANGTEQGQCSPSFV